MAEDLGSYNYTALENDSAELKRLKAQASLAADIERKEFARHGMTDGMDVLDLGCGPGFTARQIADISQTGSVLGVDLNDDLLEIARSENRKEPKANLEFASGNIYDLSNLNRKFDFVYCRFVFQHLEEPLKALAEIHEVLNPGGTVLILDVDDSLVTLYPRHRTYDKIFSVQQEYQESQGGDRFIGRKLTSYLQQSDFHELNPHVVTIPSDYLGITQFIELTIGYKIVFLRQSEDGGQYISEEEVKKLHADCAAGNYFGTIGLFSVSAKKGG